jgi:23S rRNA (guanosine2251-2'-O)-methyltransferase
VAGRRPVEEAFAAGRPAIRLLVVPQRREPLEKLVLHATRLRIPIIELEGGSLTSLAGFDGHQGVALVVEPRVFASLQEILARAAERSEPPFVLVLDSLEDPQNVGTLLRSAEAAGVHGVIFPTRRQAPLTPAAIKASAGAVEHLLLCPVDDLGAALADLHGRGLRVAGSEADAALTTRQADLRGPLAIVVGSEGQGLGPTVRKRCDLLMRIPMRGAVGSLNAAVAGSILLFEAVAQRDPEGRARRTEAAAWPGPRRAAIREEAEATAEPAAAEPVATAEPAAAEPVATAEPAAAEPVATAEPVADERTAASDDASQSDPAPAMDAAPAEEDLLPAEPPPGAKPKRPRARTPRTDPAPPMDAAPADEELLPAESQPVAEPVRTRTAKAPRD